VLDRQRWKGNKSDPTQLLDWPRDNVECPDVEDGVVPANLINACIEMANELAGGSDVQDGPDSSQYLSSIRAGSVALSYFRSTTLDATPKRFSQIVMELLQCMLLPSGGGSTLAGGMKSFGTHGQSATRKTFDHSDPI
jgi:hypothetical protein